MLWFGSAIASSWRTAHRGICRPRERWKDPASGEAVRSFTIITGAPCGVSRRFGDRKADRSHSLESGRHGSLRALSLTGDSAKLIDRSPWSAGNVLLAGKRTLHRKPHCFAFRCILGSGVADLSALCAKISTVGDFRVTLDDKRRLCAAHSARYHSHLRPACSTCADLNERQRMTSVLDNWEVKNRAICDLQDVGLSLRSMRGREAMNGVIVFREGCAAAR